MKNLNREVNNMTRNQGQSTLEYALIIAVVVGALLAMQIYFKRGVQGKLREATDDIGGQYSAGNVQAKYITTQAGDKVTKEMVGTEEAGGEGAIRTEVITAAEVTTSASGEGAEKITKTFKQELDEQGLTPKQ
ncbi:MAG: hypothetical protein PHI60_00760 [Candidatus Omnitrophica bacterium]|nr:hypothetical protein [Candidatus Omnitrophota bacterium]